MKFVCDGLSLSEAVNKVSKACAVRTTAPILECIRITATLEGISLFATDGELSIRKSVKADVAEEGAICVPGKLFADFCNKLSGEEIGFMTCEKGVELKYRDSVSYMQALPADDFPDIGFDVGEDCFVMRQSELKRVIAETAFCCAQDDSRPILKGCLIELGDRMDVTALDGYRLALSSAEIVSKSGENSIICPARTLGEIARMLGDEGEITVFTKGGMLLVEADGLTLLSRLYRGEFIKRDNVIPKAFTTKLTLSREELMASAERANILNRGDKNNLVTLEMTEEGGVKMLSTSEYGNVSEVLGASIEGQDLTISMNAKFLLDALKALDEEQVEISFNGPISPFILQNKVAKRSLYLILPVRNVS